MYMNSFASQALLYNHLLANTSNILLENSDYSRHPLFVPRFSRKTFRVFLLIKKLALPNCHLAYGNIHTFLLY